MKQQQTLEELIARAKKNEEIARNLFDIEVAILNIAETKTFLEHLLAVVTDRFNITFGWYSIIENAHTRPLVNALRDSEELDKQWVVVNSVEYLEATKGSREPLLDHAQLSRFFLLTPPDLRTRIRSIAILPLLLEGRVAGSLNLADTTQDRYRADKESFFLRQLSVKASLCLSAVVAREKVAFLATRDPLTQLKNRREMEDTLERELSRVARHGFPLGLAFIDCDDFKLVNDTYGHDIGDEYLKHVANCLNTLLRKTDMVFRFAGDEFVVLLPNQDEQGALLMAERIQQFLQDHPLIVHEVLVSIEVSIGAASTSQLPEPSARALLKLADNRLYDQKRSRKSALET
ncbi:GGDEF domain-containing protein [Hahella ganghwensis]|uniref:GGDEF domain-containing protein n=1 Tax=Hahella ganghwensis TaxID=286420 RepID=UPI000364476A|nr:GGDEF domain-containing protein [Hahella ganghwensis]